MKGSASAPSSATMNGTRWAMRPEMKATSRESRSSLATMTGHLPVLAGGQRGGELRAPVEGIGTLAGLDLGELGDEGVALGLGEAGDGGPLRLDAEARSALPGGGDPIVGDGMLHSDKDPPLPYRQHTTVCRLYVA